jgi:hypothetical protein
VVVLDVRHLRVVEYVLAVVGLLDLFAQFGGARHCCGWYQVIGHRIS